ncbi:MAG: EF-hand domain-containing protein, partial [SAR324 cluster bacterium]|nr:EF-hand domain-containing protein [SAR324 cluster bacterium]
MKTLRSTKAEQEANLSLHWTFTRPVGFEVNKEFNMKNIYLFISAFFLILIGFSSCVPPKKSSLLLRSSFNQVSDAVGEMVIGKIESGEKVLVLSMVKPYQKYIFDQYFQNGIVNALTDRNVSVLDIQHLIKAKDALAFSTEYYSGSNLFLMRNWELINRSVKFDKILEYSIEGFNEFGTSADKTWGFILHTIIYSNEGEIISIVKIPIFSPGINDSDRNKVLTDSKYSLYQKIRTTMLDKLSSGSLNLNNALMMFNDFSLTTKMNDSNTKNRVSSLWHDYIYHANMGIISALTELYPKSIKIVTKILYKKRSWQYESMALNSSPFLIKENWSDFADESNMDTLIIYRFLANEEEIREYFEDLNSEKGKTKKNLKVVFRKVDLHNNGKISWAETVPLMTAEKEDADDYDFVDIFNSGKSYGQKVTAEYKSKIKSYDNVALINLDNLEKKRSPNEIVFDDGMIEGIIESNRINLLEKGRGFELHQVKNIKGHI